jgi:hypothetical protein
VETPNGFLLGSDGLLYPLTRDAAKPTVITEGYNEVQYSSWVISGPASAYANSRLAVFGKDARALLQWQPGSPAPDDQLAAPTVALAETLDGDCAALRQRIPPSSRQQKNWSYLGGSERITTYEWSGPQPSKCGGGTLCERRTAITVTGPSGCIVLADTHEDNEWIAGTGECKLDDLAWSSGLEGRLDIKTAGAQESWLIFVQQNRRQYRYVTFLIDRSGEAAK